METRLTFEWDEHNTRHLAAHEVTREEAESIFDFPRYEVAEVVKGEDRIWALGVTDQGRYLALTYTLRGGRIRPVTAHTAKRKWRILYEEATRKA